MSYCTRKVLVKRLSHPCCGMEIGRIYPGLADGGPSYIRVKLPNGEWTSDHWAPGLFEVIKTEDANKKKASEGGAGESSC